MWRICFCRSLIWSISIIVCFSSGSIAQRVDPWEAGQGVDASRMTQNCAVSDDNQLHYDEGGFNLTIYESVRNQAIQSRKGVSAVRNGMEGAYKIYYYEPSFQIARGLDGRPMLELLDGETLRLELEPLSPPLNVIEEFIRKNRNFDVQHGNVLPLCVFAIHVEHPDATRQFQISSPAGGLKLNRSIAVSLRFSSDRLSVVQDRIAGGETITLGYTMLINSTQVSQKSLTVQQVVNSSAYRDFFSPVDGNLIWAFHARAGLSALERELVVGIYVEGRSRYEDITQNLLSQLVDTSKDEMIDISDISNGRAVERGLLGFTGTRYEADVTRELGRQAKTLTNDEWCNEFDRGRSFSGSEERSAKTAGGTSFKWWGVGGDLEGSRETNKKLALALNLTNSSKDCGKSLVENSFSDHWSGETYVPKSIIAYEVFDLESRYEPKEVIWTYEVQQSYVNRSIPVN